MESKPHPCAFLVDGEWWVTNDAAAWRWSHHPSIPAHQPLSTWHRPEPGYLKLRRFDNAVTVSRSVAMLIHALAQPEATQDDIRDVGWHFVALNQGYHQLIRSGARSDVCIMQNRHNKTPAVRVYDDSDRACALILPTNEVGCIGPDGRYLSAQVDRLGSLPKPPKAGGEE